MKKITYFCAQSKCSDNCPGHFDPNNCPACKQSIGFHTYYTGFMSKFRNWFEKKKRG